MHIAHLVNRDICATVRSVTERTPSAYLGQALLQTRLRPLRHRLQRLAEQNRPVFEALADHLGTPADPGAVVTEVERIATTLLQAMQDPDPARPLSCSPQRQLLPVERPQPLQLPRQQRGILANQITQLPRPPA